MLNLGGVHFQTLNQQKQGRFFYGDLLLACQELMDDDQIKLRRRWVLVALVRRMGLWTLITPRWKYLYRHPCIYIYVYIYNHHSYLYTVDV